MDRIPRLSTEERDNLVAYLDGELDDETSRQIEQKLSISPVARHDVDLLSRTWDLLDHLPRTTVSEDFTRKTLTMLRGDETAKPLVAAPVRIAARRGFAIATWAASLVLAGWFGYMVTHDLVPNEANLLVEDLPIIENLDLYQEVGSVEFLRELSRAGVFYEDPASASPVE